jgi:magnesium transporter
MSRKSRSKRYRPPLGSIPGTLSIDPSLPPPEMRLIAYAADKFDERKLQRPDELKAYIDDPAWTVIWLDVDGLGDEATFEAIGAATKLHKLSLADAAHPYQRPKAEDFGEYIFVIARAPFRENSDCLDTEQVSLCLEKRLVITFQERAKPGDCFDPVRERLRKSIGLLRQRGPDLLAAALLDSTIDAFFPVLEVLGEQLDLLEQQAMTNLDPAMMRELHRIRRDFLTVRRAAWPLREAVGSLAREHEGLIAESTRPYLRDCYDHTVQIIDLVETGRELGASLMEMHLSLASHRMNEIMKVLTIITTIFIPLSFIAGIYGMNFDTRHPMNMPELRSPYGYVGVLIAMTLIAGAMVYGFWRRGWIGRGPNSRRQPPGRPH